jgi:hypothetical protein
VGDGRRFPAYNEVVVTAMCEQVPGFNRLADLPAEQLRKKKGGAPSTAKNGRAARGDPPMLSVVGRADLTARLCAGIGVGAVAQLTRCRGHWPWPYTTRVHVNQLVGFRYSTRRRHRSSGACAL